MAAFHNVFRNAISPRGLMTFSSYRSSVFARARLELFRRRPGRQLGKPVEDHLDLCAGRRPDSSEMNRYRVR